MKINQLFEAGITPTSGPDNMSNTLAPKFGRSDKMLETTAGATSSGSVAPVSKSMGKMKSRGSIFQGIKTSKKYPNTPVTEDELSEEQLKAKQKREEFFNRPKDRDIGNRPLDREVQKKEGMYEGTDNPYGYEVGQTVKLSNGQHGQVIDIFDDSIEVLLPGGRTITVDFRDAQVLDEQGVDAMDASKPGPLENFDFWQARVKHFYPDANFIHEKGFYRDPQTGERIPGNVMAFSKSAGKQVALHSPRSSTFSITPPSKPIGTPGPNLARPSVAQPTRPVSVLNRVRSGINRN